MLVLPSLLFLVVGCSTWPVYMNLPEDATVRLPAGSDEVPPGQVHWAEIPSPAEETADDDPRDLSPESLSATAGNYLAGRLVGSGWDPDATNPEPWEDCGDVSQFPPFDNGMYVGESDWRLIQVVEAGVLCSNFGFRRPGPQADVLLYSVNACDLPLTPAVYGTGDPVGYNVAGQQNVWAYPVIQPTRFAVMAAAWAPDEPDTGWEYDWGIALLPAPEPGSDEIVCPSPPEAG